MNILALSKGKTKAVRSKLKTFYHEVLDKSNRDKKRGREESRVPIKPNAAAILATGAEVAIYKLGGDPKRHDEDDDHRNGD